MSSSVPTASGCLCAAVTHDHASGGGSWAGCGEQAWCDVAPACASALESAPGYSGWDHCDPAVPHGLRPGASDDLGLGVPAMVARELQELGGRVLGLEPLGEPSPAALTALAAAGAVAACALHWLASRVCAVPAPAAAESDPLLEETPCKLDPTASLRAQERMPFQSPKPVQMSISSSSSDTGSASKIPVRRLSEVLTPRQANSPAAALRARFGSSAAKRELTETKRGVQSEAEFCPSKALPRTPARGLARLSLSASPAGSDQLRFETKSDWLSHHDEGLQLTADYSGGSVPDLDASLAAGDMAEDRSGSPSSVDSDAPSSPGAPGEGALEEQSTDTEPQQMAPAGTPPATWESMAADAGIPLAELEAFGKMNAKDLIKQIGSLSTKGVAAVAAFEHTHKDRKTVQEAAAKKIELATGEEE